MRICEQNLDRLRSSLTSTYHVPVCNLPSNLTPEDAATIFVRLEATGTRVRSAELYLATFAIMLPKAIIPEVNDFACMLQKEALFSLLFMCNK